MTAYYYELYRNHSLESSDQVAQDDLAGGLVVLVAHGCYSLVVQQAVCLASTPGGLWGPEGAVGYHLDAVLLAQADQPLLVQVRMAFHLPKPTQHVTMQISV